MAILGAGFDVATADLALPDPYRRRMSTANGMERRERSRSAAAFARIRGYLSSLRKQGVKRLAALESLFTGQLLYPSFG
jgi:hypothetical protein